MSGVAVEARKRRRRLPRVLKNGRVLVGGGIVLVILLAAIFAPWIAPQDPNGQDLLATLLPPAWMEGGQEQYLLGTDNLGQDLLSLTRH